MNIIEIVGYIGSALVLISFLMTSVVRLRLVNMAGSIISGTYALIIGSYPLALMNFVLVLINAHFLWQMKTASRSYELVRVAPDDEFLTYLLGRWGDDIEALFPGIDLEAVRAGATDAYVSVFEDAPVAVAVGAREGDEFSLTLDYAGPAYRDLSIGKSLFEELAKTGLRTVFYRGPVENHRAYLKAMGFEEHHDKWGKVLKANAS